MRIMENNYTKVMESITFVKENYGKLVSKMNFSNDDSEMGNELITEAINLLLKDKVFIYEEFILKGKPNDDNEYCILDTRYHLLLEEIFEESRFEDLNEITLSIDDIKEYIFPDFEVSKDKNITKFDLFEFPIKMYYDEDEDLEYRVNIAIIGSTNIYEDEESECYAIGLEFIDLEENENCVRSFINI